MTRKNGAVVLANVSNDAAEIIATEKPYIVDVEITGTSAILFHRWSCEAVAEKAAAKKGSKAKKTDNVESYVWRDEDRNICIPTEYLRMAVVVTGKMHQDPRSPRKSAMDLLKAGLIGITELCSTGKKDWDYLDQRRVVVQRSALTRLRPALYEGWRTRHRLQVQLPQYISPKYLHAIIADAGKFTGLGDFRPSYGRFSVTGFEIV